MLPYKNLITIKRDSEQAIYLQIVEGMTRLIQEGTLSPSSKLPGTRSLGQILNIHRNTVTNAYEELEAQGWVEIVAKKGVFVNSKLPLNQGKELFSTLSKGKDIPNYLIKKYSFIEPSSSLKNYKLQLNDGIPDIRLAPLSALSRAYRGVLQRKTSSRQLTYGETLGTLELRKEMSLHLNNTRGIRMELDNVLISRGSIMGIYLVAQSLIQSGDIVVMGVMSYTTAGMIFQHAGAKLSHIGVDKDGIQVDELEDLCKVKTIKAIYVAPHHQHPTTVTLSADRRMKLLKLSELYGFAIIEDDYDYDYHYQRNPILPIASVDNFKNVIYIGSLSKIIAPAFRVGFVVAHPRLVEQMSLLRRVIDRQGDYPLEKAIAELFQQGEIQRHLRKALKVYQKRRDVLSELLEQHFDGMIAFEKPNGGLAIWSVFDKKVDLEKTAQKALKNGLFFSSGQYYTKNIKNLQATRLGFASLDIEEIEKAVELLKKSICLNV